MFFAFLSVVSVRPQVPALAPPARHGGGVGGSDGLRGGVEGGSRVSPRVQQRGLIGLRQSPPHPGVCSQAYVYIVCPLSFFDTPFVAPALLYVVLGLAVGASV